MATIDHEPLIRELIEHGGRTKDEQESTPDNPRAVRITEYVNANGKTTWGVIFENELSVPGFDRYRYQVVTQYVSHPRVIYTHPDFADYF